MVVVGAVHMVQYCAMDEEYERCVCVWLGAT